MKRQRMNNKGFTLIETSIAMLVMMVVGLSASSLFLYSVRYNAGASQRSIAMAVAQQRLEVLRSTDYSAAGLAFGTHAPETIVIAPTTTSYTQTASSVEGSVEGNQPYEAPAAANSYSNAFNPGAAATPTPTPGVGGAGSAAPGSITFQLQTQVVPFPIGTAVAAATQKQITIRITPVNGNGNSDWANRTPIEVVFHRSINVVGPYKQ